MARSVDVPYLMTFARVTLVASSLVMRAAPAAELVIVDARKNLRMNDAEPVYHDYYVSGGSDRGLAKNQLLTVVRKTPLYDSYEHRAVGDLHLKVARVKLIHVENKLSVARLETEIGRDAAPLLEDDFILVGDALETSGDSGREVSAAASAGARPAPQDAPAPVPKASTAKVSAKSEGQSADRAPAPVDAPALE